jgi:ABC-type multidrug transport system fused ATPase/permease subunit
MQGSAIQPLQKPNECGELFQRRHREKHSGMAGIFVSGLASGLARLYRHFPPARRRQLVPVVALMLFSALTELMTIGAILPFLALVANPNPALTNRVAAFPFAAFGWRNRDEMLLPATLLFASATLFAGAMRLALVRVSHKFMSRLGHDLSVEVYRGTLYQPYSYHVAHNTSEIIAGIAKVQNVVFSVLSPLLQILTAVVIGLFIFTALVVVDARTAFAAAFGFGAMYLAVTYATRRRLRANSKVAAVAYSQRVQTVQEGLGGIRDVLIDRAQPVYVDKFKAVDWALQEAQAANLFMGSAPRFVIEAFGMALIAAMTMILSGGSGGIAAALPILGALALSAQRLLPLFQVIYSSWAQIAGNRQMMFDVLAILDQSTHARNSVQLDKAKLQFRRDVTFESVSFRYSELGPLVLRNISLTIEKGARVGFIGKTGSGKSTLMDLFMGLLEPTEGVIRIDGEILDANSIPHWQTQIAHVPQSIYLADATIAENIAFGVPMGQIDMDRVRQAASHADIADFIAGLAGGYGAAVGERGVRLSGGQRQRIGIARALYKRASVLVFDEATSALDNETEAAVIHAIQSLGCDLTILIVAHRLSTIAICDKVIKLDEGQVESETSRHEAINTRAKPTFA